MWVDGYIYPANLSVLWDLVEVWEVLKGMGCVKFSVSAVIERGITGLYLWCSRVLTVMENSSTAFIAIFNAAVQTEQSLNFDTANVLQDVFRD